MQSSENTSRVAASAGPLGGRTRAWTYAHISLAVAGVMWVYSFLNSYHTNPMTTFYQEWGTAVLGLAAATLLLSKEYWRRAEIPKIVLLPIGIMLLVVVQFLLGMVPYFGQMMLATLYLLWAAMLVMLGARLRDEMGLPAVATVLAVFLVVGAELNAYAGLHQHYHWDSFLTNLVMQKTYAAVFGNVAQPNHYADYLVLGLISLGLLYARGTLRAWQAALLALPILYVLPLTGSRETWVYMGWLVAATFVWQLSERAQRPLFYFCVLLLFGFGLMHGVIKLPWLASDTGSVDSLQRMLADDVRSGGIRFYLWRESLVIFFNSPLLGAGFGQYAWQHYQLAPLLHNPGIADIYNNAHNLVFQLAAEGGLAALLILGGTLLPWLRQAFRSERTIYHWWGYALLSVLGIHSMFEYPLWYTYFLGIAALTLGMLDTSRYRMEFAVAGRALVLLTTVLGAVSLQQLYSGYRVYEHLFRLPYDPRNPAQYYNALQSGTIALQDLPLWHPYGDFTATWVIQVSPSDLNYKLKLNGDVVHFVPVRSAIYRQSLLLAQKGSMQEARVEMERAIWAFPMDFPEQQQALAALASKDPEHFRALLEFAVLKYEEYLGAVHTK